MTAKKKYILTIMVIVVFVIIFALSWIFRKEIQQSFNFGANIFKGVENPGSELPQTNPFEAETNPFEAQINPFDEVYKNPFE